MRAAAATVITVPAALVVFLAVIVGASTGGTAAGATGASLFLAALQAAANPGGEVCVTHGTLSGFSAEQATNAREIDAKAEAMSGVAAAQIAVMTAMTESGLLILGNPSVPGSMSGAQGSGTNADSVGLFQQRSNWGSVAQRMDPLASTALFVSALLHVTGWQSMSPWLAAQAVQQSGFADGSNYEVNWAAAQVIVAAIDKDPTHNTCGELRGGRSVNEQRGSHGLPSDYRIPADATAAEATVVAFAIAQLDKPYVFGAAGPDAYDCSGLTLAAWAQVGVTLVHLAADQLGEGTAVLSESQAQPGDLVLVPGDDGTLAAPGHVGMWIGRWHGIGLVLNASDPSDGIRVQSFGDFVAVGHGLAGIRHIE